MRDGSPIARSAHRRRGATTVVALSKHESVLATVSKEACLRHTALHDHDITNGAATDRIAQVAPIVAGADEPGTIGQELVGIEPAATAFEKAH